jgi:hypothetical protein
MRRARWALGGIGIALLAVGCAGLDVGNVIEGGMKLIQSGDDIKGAFTDIDEPEEVELGRAVTAMIGSRYPLLRDEAVTRYVALVGNAARCNPSAPTCVSTLPCSTAPTSMRWPSPAAISSSPAARWR